VCEPGKVQKERIAGSGDEEEDKKEVGSPEGVIRIGIPHGGQDKESQGDGGHPPQ